MPVLEVTQLRLRGVEVGDQTLLKSLSTVRRILQTNSQFYSCIEDPFLIFILGIWPSLDAHCKFLASPAREEVLGPQEEMLEFRWSAHLEINAMDELPLDAPVVAITRVFVEGNDVDAYDQAAAKDLHTIVKATRPFNVVSRWRLDSAPGYHEAFQFTGWENAQAHAAFEDARGGSAARADYEVHHVWNMEGRTDKN
jgi:heme-degrading monooxygenase HmoA